MTVDLAFEGLPDALFSGKFPLVHITEKMPEQPNPAQSNEDGIPAIFIDSSRLVKTNFNNPYLQKLLKLSRDRKLKIIISQIVREELIANIRDDFVACSVKVRKQQDKQKNDLRNNPLYVEIGDGYFTHAIPDDGGLMSDAQRRAEMFVDKFIDDNKILVKKIEDDHTLRVFGKYFTWQPPFDCAGTFEELQNEGKRAERKKNIPDGFIIEAAIDLIIAENNMYVLCGDGPLKKALPPEFKDRIFDELEKLIELIESPPSTPATPAGNVASMAATENGDGMQVEAVGQQQAEAKPVLAAKFESDAMLTTRILGYVFWFSANPISKETLYKYLKPFGYSAELIASVAQTLSVTNSIKDTGNYFIPVDRQLCKAAADSIMPEILELLDQG